MDDENIAEGQPPSTSKKCENGDSRKEEQDDPSTSKRGERDDCKEDRMEEEEDDRSYTNTSSSYSVVSSNRSKLLMKADTRPKAKILPFDKKEKPDKRKRVQRGRVTKRRGRGRRTAKRHTHAHRHTDARRATRRQGAERKERDHSVTSLVSRLSSPQQESTCRYCGHRCCGRRLMINEDKRVEEEAKRRKRRALVRKIVEELKKMRQRSSSSKGYIKRKRTKQRGVRKGRKQLGKKRGVVTDKKRDKREENFALVTHKDTARKKLNSTNQVGSTCKMLSPLFVKTNETLEADPEVSTENNYKEITPEMIFYTLQRLEKWREYLNLEPILSNIKISYPVNPNTDELTTELLEKMRVAVIAGIVEPLIKNEEFWHLTSDVLRWGLNRNHVSMFWDIYGRSHCHLWGH